MEFFNNHVKLYTTAALMFIGLTILVAIMPALNNQANNKPLPGAEALSPGEVKGKDIFIANGCVACHTQQVRNVDMDNVWGSRPSIAADYAGAKRTDIWRNTATLMGTERTGPDLTDIGNRNPSSEWNLVHLYNPRIVVKESIMPAYPWLFRIKAEADEGDVVVGVPDEFKRGNKGVVVASEDALNLVAYLQSLKQTPLPDGSDIPDFLYKTGGGKSSNPSFSVEANESTEPVVTAGADGGKLYAMACQSCHQPNGEGLPGAFPSLVGSKIVSNEENLELYVDIIMNGYDARPEYAVMTGIGTSMKWTEHEVAAVINYERSQWGNGGQKVSAEEIKLILESIQEKMTVL